MKPYIVMIGSHPQRVIGGIATIIEMILASSLTERFDIEHIPSVVDGSKAQKLWAVTKALGGYLARLLTRRVSLVYVHVGGDKSVYRKAAFILLGKVFGRKFLLHCHGGNTVRYYLSRHWLGRWYLRSALRMGDRIIVVSDTLRTALHHVLPEQDIHFLPNAVSAPAVSMADQRLANGGPVRVLYLGHFLKLKGIYDLVEAIPQIAAAAPEAQFLLCGLHEVKQVHDLCQRRGVLPVVEHLGPVPFEERWAALQKADIFVLPSYEEGLPVTVLEAMAVGLPVVTTPVGGIPQVVADGVNGFLIQPGDVDSLAARILQLAKDPTLRRRMGQANRLRIAEAFDAGPFLDKLEGHLRSLTNPSWACATSRPTGPRLARVAPQEVVPSRTNQR
ncbi:MAG: glycosyltransferase family 4 protein [Acidobacteria bacterium]|nr:glycosyltransferase family 4 protein [Acidobacteriota bacterium]